MLSIPRKAKLLRKEALVQTSKLIRVIGSLELLCCYVVAVCHDIGHAGTSSLFLVKARSDIASIFGTDSPLERGHVAIFSLLMQVRDAY